MIPVRDNLTSRQPVIVTWTLVGLLSVIYLWDRNLNLFGPSIRFADLALRPGEISDVLSGRGDIADLGKLFTSMFLHGNVPHIVFNLMFLIAFGPNVERALGGFRYALYYLFWGLAASAAQIYSDPNSFTSVLGASGAIGGVLGAYFLLFPGNQIRFIIPPIIWTTFKLPAWILLGLWFVAQFIIPQQGVATWAHIGGFLAGMVTILVLGGRDAVVKPETFLVDRGFDEDD
jgi:membrane associated rhomboid family serine protease